MLYIELMPNESKTTYVDLSHKRDIEFPFMLNTAGIIQTSDLEHYDMNYHTLEFCLRLSSEEEEAVDELGGKIYRNQFPHLFIKRAGVRHRYTINSSRHAIFLIYPPELESAFSAIGISVESPGFEFKLTSELEKLLDIFLALIPQSQNRGIAEKFDMISFQIIENIFMQKFLPKASESSTDDIIREIASYLQVHFADTIDLNSICRKFGISRRSFFRNWSRLYDHTPLQYILDLKLREAERLLLTRDIRIKEVAAMLGFDNHSYFIQAFRRTHGGITPGEFRRKCKGSPVLPD